MSKISCDVCMDLIPLVKDGVASEDSRLLVEEHIDNCESCSAVYRDAQGVPPMDDAAVIGKIKREMLIFILGAMLVGTLVGMIISDGENMFYNALIMPAIGALGYLLLKNKSFFVPIVLFLISMFWVFVREILNGALSYSSMSQIIAMSAAWSLIFAGFTVIGIFIVMLLHYAFRKEV